jgi:sugar lactone lactonase YvrE
MAWDISTGSYASKSLSVTSQETNPLGVAFSADGTKAYIVGTASDTIYQYTLSTAWDVSTGSYASKWLDVNVQEINPRSVAFSADGTKAYIVGGARIIHQYTLSTAWDISTGSYASKSLNAGTEVSNAWGLAFSADGTKAYVSGITNDTIYQYTLSTAWDVSTGSYSGNSMSVVSESGLPFDVTFRVDGTEAYVVSGTGVIYQYTLSTAWDVSTGSYASKSLSVTGEEVVPAGLAFSADGTKTYIVGSNDVIYQYTLEGGGSPAQVPFFMFAGGGR